MTPVPREGYGLPLPAAGRWREILNTDAAVYGGSGLGNMGGVDARSPARTGIGALVYPAAAGDGLARARTGTDGEVR